MIHYSNVKCDECGERHSPDHPVECHDACKLQLAECRAELAERVVIDTERGKMWCATERQLERITAERDKLRAACNVCECSITEFVEADQPSSTDWVNLRASRHLARTALEPGR